MAAFSGFLRRILNEVGQERGPSSISNVYIAQEGAVTAICKVFAILRVRYLPKQ